MTKLGDTRAAPPERAQVKAPVGSGDRDVSLKLPPTGRPLGTWS